MSRLRVVLAASAAVSVALLSAPVGVAAADRYDVTVTRTGFGIPHVKAKDLRSAGYGYAKALAEDAACVVAESYVTVNAERSKHFGASKRYEIRGNGSSATNLNSDFFYQRIIDRGTVERLVAQEPPIGPKPEIEEALEGYVAGWNAWLREVGGADGIDDPACRGEEWVRPITLMDVYRRFHSLALLASTGVAIDGIGGAEPITGPVDAQARVRSVSPGEIDRRLGGLGSNAYAIGKEASRSGHGLVYGNPHFPWQGSERFYQAHLTVSDEKIDVTGGSLLGVPIILIGTTRGMAWSHTVSTARRFVPYQLTLVPGDPTSYVEDGVVRKMTADRVTVDVGGGRTRTRTLWSSHHGPIFTSLLGLPLFPWTPVTAFAMHDANVENFGRLLNHFFHMNKAQTVDEVDRILKKYLGIPWVNTIAADTAGNAYYADVGAIPHIDREKYRACNTTLGVVVDELQRLPVLDGARAACLPGSDPDAIVPGILGPANLPTLRRDDHVSNMNDSYWLTNPDQPLEGYSRIIGDERAPRTLRTRVGIKQLQQRLDGSDGLGEPGFTLENLMTVGLQNRVHSAELWRDQLVAGCSSQACEVLRRWDLRNDLDSPGAVLWQRFMARLDGVLPIALPYGILGPFSGSFDPSDPVDTPAGLATANPLVANALTQAVSDMGEAGLPLDATLRTGQTVRRRGETIPIHGGPGGSGIFNVITPSWTPSKGGYTEVTHGSSFVQAVHLTPGCPEVRTFLTYGLSPNASSPRTSDQTKRFSEKKWIEAPFCAKDLERDRSAVRRHIADLGPTVVQVREARGEQRPRIVVERPRGQRARVVIRLRRGGKVIRRIVRKGTRVAVSPRLRKGSYRVDVTVGKRTARIRAKQR